MRLFVEGKEYEKTRKRWRLKRSEIGGSRDRQTCLSEKLKQNDEEWDAMRYNINCCSQDSFMFIHAENGKENTHAR